MIKIDAYDLATYVKTQQGGPLLTILEDVRDFVFIKDIEGRFVYSNRSHRDHLGKTEAELLGKNDFDLFPANLAESFYAAETHMYESQKPVIRIQESMDHTGAKFYSTAIKNIICDNHGNVLGLIGTVHRISNDSNMDIEESKAYIMSALRKQPGVTHSQLKAFEASLPAALGKH